MTTIFIVDEENNGGEWWEAARRDTTAPPEFADLLRVGGPDEAFVPPERLHAVLAWCASLPDWNTGPIYAPHPLVWSEVDG